MANRRVESETGIYHAVSRGTGRQIIFEDNGDRKKFLDALESALEKTSATLYAWCLMGNHFHLIIRSNKESLSKCMHIACGTYAHWFNKKSGRTGHLFQERFSSEPILSEAHLLSAVRYVHMNPEKAGISKHNQYFWSSYREYLGHPGLCDTVFVLDAFGGMNHFVRFHAGERTEDRFIDADEWQTAPRRMNDQEAMRLATSILDTCSLEQLKSLAKDERDRGLAKLKKSGLSVRQIERLTGIGKSSIARA